MLQVLNHHSVAQKLIYSGALLFFSHGQKTNVTDLSMLVLESLETTEMDLTDGLLEYLVKMLSLMNSNSPLCLGH